MSKEGEQKDMKNIEEESSIEIKPFSTKKIRPKLFIDTENDGIQEILDVTSTPVQNVFAETDKYSITPTTFKARTLFAKHKIIKNKVIENLKAIEQKGKELQEKQLQLKMLESKIEKELISIVKDEMSEKEVFGHMQKTKLTSDIQAKYDLKLTEINNYSKELQQYYGYLEKHNGLVLSHKDTYSNDHTVVSRYGVDIANMTLEQTKDLVSIYNPIIKKKESVKSGSNKSGKDDPEVLLLHPIEVFLIRDAIGHLFKNTDNTILVDIFARDLKNGSILLEDSKPKVHTIVLYKNNEKEIIVVDPSNSEFSQHLAINTVRIFGDDAIKIIVPSKQLKIYEPASKDKVGPNSDQYRDCIDIAVKIAFSLNILKQENLEIPSFIASELIQEITNNIDINHSLSIISDNPFRIRQASDEKIRKQSNESLKNLDKQLKNIGGYPEIDIAKLSDFLQIKCMSKLYELNTLNYGNTIEGLVDLKHHNQDDYIKFLSGNSSGIEGYDL